MKYKKICHKSGNPGIFPILYHLSGWGERACIIQKVLPSLHSAPLFITGVYGLSQAFPFWTICSP